MVASSSDERSERRRHRRIQTFAAATLNYDRQLIPCLVLELSRGGARVRLLEENKLPRGSITLETARLGPVRAEVVWQRKLLAGIRFVVETVDEPLRS